MNTRRLICKSQIRTIEDVVEDWKAEHESAMKVRDIEDVVRLCHFVRDLFEGWSSDLWESAAKGDIASPQAEGEGILHVIGQALEVMTAVRRLIDWAEQWDYSIDGKRLFDAAVRDIEDLKKDLLARWPLVDEVQVKRSREEFGRGEFQSAEDVLRELHCANPE